MQKFVQIQAVFFELSWNCTIRWWPCLCLITTWLSFFLLLSSVFRTIKPNVIC